VPRKKKTKGKKRYPKLTPRQKKLAGKYISEEFHTRKYKPKQSVAIGLSRARAATKKRKKRRVK